MNFQIDELIWATGFRDKIDKMLNTPGININAINRLGQTVLMVSAAYSSKYSSNATVLKLINCGANIDWQNTVNGLTALILAAGYSNTDSTEDTVRILLKHGAQLELQDLDKCTALMWAIIYQNNNSNRETVKLFIEKYCNISNYMDCNPIVI